MMRMIAALPFAEMHLLMQLETSLKVILAVFRITLRILGSSAV